MIESGSAAERYKELCGLATGALETMRARDQIRTDQLWDEVDQTREAAIAAAGRERVTRLIARLRWEAAVEALWDQRWLTMTPLPRPAAVAQPYDLEQCERDIDRAFDRLEESLRRRGLLDLPMRARRRP